MPINKADGKIYKIISDSTDKIYIGSTTKKKLSERLSQHRKDYRKWLKNPKKYDRITSFEILKYCDCRIVLIENYPCNNKDELRQREEFYRKEYINNCVNHNA